MKKYIICVSFCFLIGDYSAGFPGANFQYGTNAREVALSKSTLSTYNTGFVDIYPNDTERDPETNRVCKINCV